MGTLPPFPLFPAQSNARYFGFGGVFCSHGDYSKRVC